jgi:glucokinase
MNKAKSIKSIYTSAANSIAQKLHNFNHNLPAFFCGLILKDGVLNLLILIIEITMAVIALDLGGTKLAAALFKKDGGLSFRSTVSIKRKKGNKVGKLIIESASAILQKAQNKKIKVTAIGICVPGIAHAVTGTVWAPNIAGWEDYPLKAELERVFKKKNVTVHIDSDRACYILGETWHAKEKLSDVIFLSVGTGIGAGILINGKVLRGFNDIAGAIGWMSLSRPFEKKYVTCGDFEYHASGEGLVKVAKELLLQKKYRSSVLNRHQPDNLTAKDIFLAYETNDKLAKIVLQQAIAYWGMAVANLVSLFNPQKIILGGGVFGPAIKFLDMIYAEALKWGQPISMKQVKLEAARLGADAGLYGAARMAMNA